MSRIASAAAMVAVAVVVVIVASAARARAQPANGVGTSEAERLFDQGRNLVDQGKYAEACAVFQESARLERAGGTLLNLAECAEREGKIRNAWKLYLEAGQEYDKTRKPERAKIARDRADAILPRLATLVLRLAEPRLPGLAVRIGDRAAIPAPEIVERLDPGQVTIVVSAPGREAFKITATADANRQVTVDVPALRDAVVGGVGPATATTAVTPGAIPSDGPRTAGRKRSRLYLAVGLGGAGVLALVGSGIIGLAANRAYDEPFETGACFEATPKPRCDLEGAEQLRDAGSTADLATGVGVAGALLVAAGAVVYFTAPRETVTVAPVASPSALGAAITARF